MSSSKEKPVRRIRCPVKRHIRSDCTPPSLSAPHCAAHLTSPLQQSHFFLTHWFDPFCDRIRLSVRLVCAPKRTVGNCSSERLWLLQTTECLNPSNRLRKQSSKRVKILALSQPRTRQSEAGPAMAHEWVGRCPESAAHYSLHIEFCAGLAAHVQRCTGLP